MLDMQFWLMSFGFFLLGLAVGDKIFSYFPKNIKKNKLSIFLVPTILGGLVFSIPVISMYWGFFDKPVIEKYFNEPPSKLKEDLNIIDNKIKSLELQYATTNNTYEKNFIKEAIKSLENQKEVILKILDFNFYLYLSCGVCIFTGSLISIILRKQDENNEH